jgi:hypothetical protein
MANLISSPRIQALRMISQGIKEEIAAPHQDQRMANASLNRSFLPEAKDRIEQAGQADRFG